MHASYPGLDETLAEIAESLAGAEAPWWIIGSAAVALHGADVGRIADVDVLVGRADAVRLCRTWGLSPAQNTGDGKFRSSLFACWRGSPLPVEVMADTQVFADGGWHPVHFETRQATAGGLFVPARAELVAMLKLFGRTKDLRRAAALH
ncbi:MAG: hypothetical protein ACR2FK_00330 [Sphingomicrobium sp.]